MTGNEKVLAYLLSSTIAIAGAIIVLQQIEIDELKENNAAHKRYSKTYRKFLIKLINKMNRDQLEDLGEDLKNEIEFQTIISKF